MGSGNEHHRPSFRDAFGTAVGVEELIDALRRGGLSRGRLIVRDEALTLHHASDEDSLSVAKALTELRGLLSPLTSMHAVAGEQDSGLSVDDRRANLPRSVHLVEMNAVQSDPVVLVQELRDRSGLHGCVTFKAADSDRDGPRLAGHLARAFAETERSDEPPLTILFSENPRTSGVPAQPGNHHFLLAFEREDGRGVLLALSSDLQAIDWFRRAVLGDFDVEEAKTPILLDGLEWEVGRRPIIAAVSSTPTAISRDFSLCPNCGDCGDAEVDLLWVRKDGIQVDTAHDDPSLMYDVLEACPNDAVRPRYSKRSATFTRTLTHRPHWLTRLLTPGGSFFPSPSVPSYLRRKPEAPGPRYVLGLSVMTMQEHAAVLLRDGRVVGAIEEERLSRIRHHGWRSPDRPAFVTAAVDPTICLEEVFCHRSIALLLEREGITLDDIEMFAVNGLHGRYRNLFSRIDDGALPIIRVGRVAYVPHHLCHAASSYRVANLESSWVFTVDGRGDRETATLFRGEGEALLPCTSILSLADTSIGGLYESATRLVGFGSHGQGSFMALASFGRPELDVSNFLSVDEDGVLTCHESGFSEAFAAYGRQFDDPINVEHHTLAASVQEALETTVEGLLASQGVERGADGLCLAGGVTLNCQMNDRLRRRFEPGGMFAQPGANDAGTALGAALEAWVQFGGKDCAPMEHAYWGPDFSDAAIEDVLKRSGLTYKRSERVSADVARRLASGEIFCFFQHRMEFGPRALGARSIIADPRSMEVKNRANALKSRQNWRPFGPSVLAGHEHEFFENAFDTRFMLFTQAIKPAKRAFLEAVAHVDGTTRPQIVHPEPNTTYYETIREFFAITGVPMILNTSFNRRGEPIVCTPEDAIESFVGLGADALAMGSFIVEKPAPEQHVRPLQPTIRPWWTPFGEETLFLSADEATHDRITGRPGDWRRAFLQAQRQPARGVTLLMLAREMAALGNLVKSLLRSKVSALTFRFPAPQLSREGRVIAEHVPRLSDASVWVSRVGTALKARGIRIEVQMIPQNSLPASLRENVTTPDGLAEYGKLGSSRTWDLYSQLAGE